VGSNALVAPLDMYLQLSPVFLGSLQYQASHAGDVVAGILQHVVELLAKNGWLLWQHNTELGQQSPDAVDAGRAFLLEGFAQAMHTQHALLSQCLGGHEIHVRS